MGSPAAGAATLAIADAEPAVEPGTAAPASIAVRVVAPPPAATDHAEPPEPSHTEERDTAMRHVAVPDGHRRGVLSALVGGLARLTGRLRIVATDEESDRLDRIDREIRGRS